MKARYAVLDGLRGTAALSVVVFHLMEMVWLDPADNPLHHAYLAVDLFFMLSGFIVGHAYDDRWGQMGLGQFLVIRLKRLHPLVVLGVLLGLAGYVLDPFAAEQHQVPLARLLITAGLMLLVLPSPGLPNRYGETHSLNGPTWTLLQEYLANLVYGLIGPRISRRALWAVVIVAGAVLVATAATRPHLGAGWGWDTFWIAPVRTAFPFFAGLLLFRLGARIKIPAAYPLLSLALVAVFAFPALPTAGAIKANGLLEAGLIIVAFPLIIAAGAAGAVHGHTEKLCDFFGKISYPLYITHYPFIYVYGHWVWTTKPERPLVAAVAAGLLVFFVLLAWLALKLWDQPARAWLGRRRLLTPAVSN
jgi:peptidoglycan/LPS O-acetylase OafA/YrhL